MPTHCLATQVEALQVDVEHAVPLLLGQIEEVSHGGNPGH